MAQILQPTPLHLDQLAGFLTNGGIVAIPTETVYGLAGNALDPEAIARIYAAKGRPSRNPLIVHVGSLQQLDEIALINETGRKLAEKFWPGPLTLIFPKKPIVPDAVTAGLDSVAVRIPSHPVFRELAARCSFPLAAPSANPSGYVSPTRAEHVLAQMGDSIQWILDGGPSNGGIESTILSLVDPQNPVLLRQGCIPQNELEKVLGCNIVTREDVAEDSRGGLLSPGLLKRHYSPRTRVRVFEGKAPHFKQNEAIVFLNSARCKAENHFSFSADGSLEAVARHLYDRLQSLDQKGLKRIYLELPPAAGIGLAIRDRMQRAAARD